MALPAAYPGGLDHHALKAVLVQKAVPLDVRLVLLDEAAAQLQEVDVVPGDGHHALLEEGLHRRGALGVVELAELGPEELADGGLLPLDLVAHLDGAAQREAPGLQLLPDHLDVRQGGVLAHLKGVHQAADGDGFAVERDVEDLHGPPLGDGKEIAAVAPELAVQGGLVGDLRPDPGAADDQPPHPMLGQIVVDLLHVVIKGPLGDPQLLQKLRGGHLTVRVQQTAQDIGLSAFQFH